MTARALAVLAVLLAIAPAGAQRAAPPAMLMGEFRDRITASGDVAWLERRSGEHLQLVGRRAWEV
jgi:hypothetical protein